jgi:plastocyanin
MEPPAVERVDSGPAVRGQAPPAGGGFPSVVLLAPDADVPPPPPPEASAVMDQYGNAFHPKVLLVRRGQPVDFQNSEDVLHNVHVIDFETRETIFNVGTPVVGSYRHRFARPGVYDVSCEIHPAMAAFVVVTETPYAAVSEAGGRFEIEDVPPGRYRLTVWNLDPKRRLEAIVEIGPGTTELALDSTP